MQYAVDMYWYTIHDKDDLLLKEGRKDKNETERNGTEHSRAEPN